MSLNRAPANLYRNAQGYKGIHTYIYIYNIGMTEDQVETLTFPELWVNAVPSAVPFFWVAVKELKLSYYIGETILITIYTHHGILILAP